MIKTDPVTAIAILLFRKNFGNLRGDSPGQLRHSILDPCHFRLGYFSAKLVENR